VSDFYLAPSLVTLRNEINESNPNRDKASDGWIGDSAHQLEISDHNPDPTSSPPDVVRAIDVDNDGIDPDRLVAIAIKDRRTNYVIWNGHIWSRLHNFVKKIYTGKSKHTEHVHISIRHDAGFAKDTRPWGFASHPTPVEDFVMDAETSKQVRTIVQQELRTALGNSNSETDADPTHDSIADIRRDLREIKAALKIT
jgi:hypothetical protein